MPWYRLQCWWWIKCIPTPFTIQRIQWLLVFVWSTTRQCVFCQITIHQNKPLIKVTSRRRLLAQPRIIHLDSFAEAHYNVGILRTKFDQFQYLINSIKPSVVYVTETNFNDEWPSSNITMQRQTLLGQDRVRTDALIIKEKVPPLTYSHITYSGLNLANSGDKEAVWVSVTHAIKYDHWDFKFFLQTARSLTILKVPMIIF
jgi:hypothetical protein